MDKNVIPLRKDIKNADKWDLTVLFKNDDDWEKALSSIVPDAEKLSAYKGKLAVSPETLLAALQLLEKFDRTAERVGQYAGLQNAADEGDTEAQNKVGRYYMTVSKAAAAVSFMDPEIQEIPADKIQEWLKLPEFENYRIYLSKLLRFKPYILSEKEERLMALQSEPAATAEKTFSVLNNVDMDFGSIRVGENDKPLTQTTWSQFMEYPDREIRKEAYKRFYQVFSSHENTLAGLYAGSVNQDVFITRARGYKSCLERALYKDKVPVAVYTNLIDTVHKNLPALHRYYTLRRKVLGLKDLRHYDVYVPLVKNIKTQTSYEEAVEICRSALDPLGKDYTDTLCNGLLSGWADRYENRGKRSGAFSSGGYDGYPYILLNYKDDVIRDVFTMAHEGGHSMHSWYSVRNNPYLCYNYTIFEAEVASTFNEELVFEYLLKNAADKQKQAYLISMRAGDILATLYRQTMFAEYELKAHESVENGTPLSAEVLRNIYRKLLEQYFGPEMIFEQESDLEGLRIPHFYGQYYVYKYATGISAAIALADRVVNGGKEERADYFKFLKSGGSRYPIDVLKIAGVDMEKPEPVQAALHKFETLVAKLEDILITT
jgi:oligoendopeptidase F